MAKISEVFGTENVPRLDCHPDWIRSAQIGFTVPKLTQKCLVCGRFRSDLLPYGTEPPRVDRPLGPGPKRYERFPGWQEREDWRVEREQMK